MILSFPCNRRGFIAALLLMVASLASESKAHAGCGDYVTIDGKTHAGTAADVSGDAGPRATPDRPKPCSGPNCKASPRPEGVPPFSPTQVRVWSHDRDAVDSTFRLSFDSATSIRQTVADCLGSPVASHLDLLDPPRSN